MRDQVFISYSHKDSAWLEQLQIHLRPRVRQSVLTLWDDTHLRAGDDWQKKIQEALKRARVAVLLVSPDFLASDFIAENELPSLLRAAEHEGLRIIWVPLKACGYAETEIVKYHPAYPPTRPLAGLTEAEKAEAFEIVCREVRDVFSIKTPSKKTIKSEFHCFISLDSIDHLFVSELIMHLGKCQIDAFVSLASSEIAEASRYLDKCANCVVLIGTEGAHFYQRLEISIAIQKTKTESTFKIIPVLLPGATKTALEDTPFAALPYVDYSQNENNEALHRLVSLITGRESTPSEETKQIAHCGYNPYSFRRQLYDAFIAHGSADADLAAILATVMKKRGFRIWTDATCIQPGDDISKKRYIGCISSALYIVIIGNEHDEPWQSEDIKKLILQKRNSKKSKKMVIPVVFPSIGISKMPMDLSSLQSVDLRTGFQTLIDTILDNRKLKIPTTKMLGASTILSFLICIYVYNSARVVRSAAQSATQEAQIAAAEATQAKNEAASYQSEAAALRRSNDVVKEILSEPEISPDALRRAKSAIGIISSSEQPDGGIPELDPKSNSVPDGGSKRNDFPDGRIERNGNPDEIPSTVSKMDDYCKFVRIGKAINENLLDSSIEKINSCIKDIRFPHPVVFGKAYELQIEPHGNHVHMSIGAVQKQTYCLRQADLPINKIIMTIYCDG